ncbi:MAG TPA: hypothetical protein VM118_04280 [Acidobacteriota bacterium]|nr:hypothetical protein [Acidobacteriota bacterium]
MSADRNRSKRRLWGSIVIIAVLPAAAFAIEKLQQPRLDGLAILIVLIVTAIVFLFQLREAQQSRESADDATRMAMMPRVTLFISETGKKSSGQVDVSLESHTDAELLVRLVFVSSIPIREHTCQFKTADPYDLTKSFRIPPNGTLPITSLSWLKLLADPQEPATGEEVQWFLQNWHRGSLEFLVTAHIQARNTTTDGDWFALPRQTWVCNAASRTWKKIPEASAPAEMR